MNNYKEPIRPTRLRSPVSILRYLLHRKGECYQINCGVCPLSATQLYNSVEYSCGASGSNERMSNVIKKAIEFKVLTEEEVFGLLL